MKSLPVKLVGGRYIEASPEEATHLSINIPGPTGRITLPVITKGRRDETGCWSWNGSVEAPTLRPSILTTGHDFRCHIWLNDGQAQFLDDCSHEFKGQTRPLNDLEYELERK